MLLLFSQKEKKTWRLFLILHLRYKMQNFGVYLYQTLFWGNSTNILTLFYNPPPNPPSSQTPVLQHLNLTLDVAALQNNSLSSFHFKESASFNCIVPMQLRLTRVWRLIKYFKTFY